MMSVSGHIKLIDFGLCADFSTGSRVSMVGSPFWVPPEMIKKEPHTYPADVWSFGVCILEFYLMAPPYATSAIKCMYMTATKGLVDQVPETASAHAQNFLQKCLEPDQTKRATPAELLEHPWVTRTGLSKGIDSVLRDIFLTTTLSSLGL